MCPCVCTSGKYHPKLFDPSPKKVAFFASQKQSIETARNGATRNIMKVSHCKRAVRGPKLDQLVRLTLPGVWRFGNGEREEFGSLGCAWMLYGCKQFCPK